MRFIISFPVLYVQLTVHHDKLQTTCIKYPKFILS